jgi:hypothetical protein
MEMTHYRRYKFTFIAFSIIGLVLTAFSKPSFADHDPGIAHFCVKNNGKLRLAGSSAECGIDETHLSLVTEQYAKRLHGNTIAEVEREFPSREEDGGPGYFRVELVFCDPAPGISGCDPSSITLLSAPIFDDSLSDKATLITYNADNTPEFPAIVERLTNGNNDLILPIAEYYDEDEFPGSSHSDGFYESELVPVGSPNYLDLQGLTIDNITVWIDRVNLDYLSATDATYASMKYRVFFGLVPQGNL